jgi:DNA-binding CsgD family transcriptional regulator
MARSAAAIAESRFRQLCCLGLGAEAVIPAVLAELREIIPSLGRTFFFLDDNSALRNVYDENPEAPKIAQFYVENFYNRPDREMGAGFEDALRRRVGVEGLEEIVNVDVRTFYGSDLYNLIYRPLGYDGMIRIACWDGGRPVGGLMLSRAPGDRRFSDEERQHLNRLEPFLAIAASGPEGGSDRLVDSGRAGVIVASAAGKLIHASAEARTLLFYACHPTIVGGRQEPRETELPRQVVGLCLRLQRIFAGDTETGAPACHFRNAWGGFRFQAQWLEGPDSASGLIGIAISHQEPITVHLLRWIARLPLSPRQAEICLLLAGGGSQQEIAVRLGISKHTAVAHSRAIYERLGVHSRSDLVGLMLTDPRILAGSRS